MTQQVSSISQATEIEVIELLKKSPLVKTEADRSAWLNDILPQANDGQLQRVKQVLLDAERVIADEMQIILQGIAGLMKEAQAAVLLANEEQAEKEDEVALAELETEIQNV